MNVLPGLHRILFQFSPDDYQQIGEIWNGPHPEDGNALEVQVGAPEGFDPPDLDAEPQLTAPLGPDNGAGRAAGFGYLPRFVLVAPLETFLLA